MTDTTRTIEAGARAIAELRGALWMRDRNKPISGTYDYDAAKACITAAIASGALVPARAVAEMRERCAKVADNMYSDIGYPVLMRTAGRVIGREIRQLDTAPASGDYVVVPRGNLTAMAQFVMWAMNTGPWDGCGLDGGDVQDKAEELGLIVKTKHDPKIHGDRIEAEAGDDWFVPPEWLTVVLNAASSNGGGK